MRGGATLHRVTLWRLGCSNSHMYLKKRESLYQVIIWVNTVLNYYNESLIQSSKGYHNLSHFFIYGGSISSLILIISS